jgi:hypothetical protein
MIFIERPTFQAHPNLLFRVFQFYTTKPQERVQVFPKIIKWQFLRPSIHILGQLPDAQIVFKLYLSTKLRSSVYFFPIGNFTFNHFGFATGKVFSKTASINQFLDCKVRNVDLKQNVLVMKLQHVFVIKIQ